MSFLEMLDVVNERLTEKGEEPIAFDHDCREGICGTCGVVVNGRAHGPRTRTTACQLHMRSFKDGDTLMIEPWRAKAFPVVKDLIVDRSAFDRIIAAGGFVSVQAGSAPDGNAIPVPKDGRRPRHGRRGLHRLRRLRRRLPERLGHALRRGQGRRTWRLLPQGQPERYSRVPQDGRGDGRGGLRQLHEPRRVRGGLPEGHQLDVIARMNRDFLKATLMGAEESKGEGGSP